MHPLLEAILTGSTCGDACWEAREDICRCSCHGKNHGCKRDGRSAERTARIDGTMYRLAAVGEGVHEQAEKINEAAGIDFRYASTSRERYYRNIPAKVRRATLGQVQRWAELAQYRCDDWKTFKANNPDAAPIDWPGMHLPYLLWLKVEPTVSQEGR
jgi:hypothetical protein